MTGPGSSNGRLRPPPIFVLTAARSGSTLLRYLLDAHPAVACPPETRIGTVLSAVEDLWRDSFDGVAGDAAAAVGSVAARAAVEHALTTYADSRGKLVWCDKSVAAVPSLDTITAAFPDARYLCLYRHPMDMIASGLEASRFGFGHFGFKPYVQRRPDNVVAALAQYWVDRTSGIIGCEEAGKVRSHRVTYERLVGHPDQTLHEVLEFLELEHPPALVETMLEAAFGSPHGGGLRDYKADFATGVHGDSVGSGRAVPEYLVDGAVREPLRGLCRRLGYEEIGAAWNVGWPAPPSGGGPRPVPAWLESFVDSAGGVLGAYRGPQAGSFCLAVAEDGERWLWQLDSAAGLVEPLPGREPLPGVTTWATHGAVLRQVIGGRIEPSQALHWGLLRRDPPGGVAGDAGAERKLLAALLAPAVPVAALLAPAVGVGPA